MPTQRPTVYLETTIISYLAARRLEMISNVPVLQTSDPVVELAEAIVGARLVPRRYSDDAIHVALASVHGMEYLLTWNMTHLANASVRRRLEGFLAASGIRPPIICTPADILED